MAQNQITSQTGPKDLSDELQHIADELASIGALGVDSLDKLPDFMALVVYVLKGIPKDTTRRVYKQTFSAWYQWTLDNNVESRQLTQTNVKAFLLAQGVGKSRMSSHLAALRTVTKLMAQLDGDDAKTMHELLREMKTPKPATVKTRSKNALSDEECNALLEVYATDDSLSGRRNLAIIAVLLMTGVRRSELVAMQWENINYNNATIFIPHGKGDKKRTVAIMDGPDGLTVNALKQWQGMQGDDTRKYVFCRLENTGTVLGADKPISTTEVYKLIERTSQKAFGYRYVEYTDKNGKKRKKREALKKIAPHDFRRTLITGILDNGGNVHDAQAQAGHASGSTTLIYADSSDAKKRRDKVKLPFGGVSITQPIPLAD